MTACEIKKALDKITNELKKPGAPVMKLLEERERLLKKLNEATLLNLPNAGRIK